MQSCHVLFEGIPINSLKITLITFELFVANTVNSFFVKFLGLSTGESAVTNITRMWSNIEVDCFHMSVQMRLLGKCNSTGFTFIWTKSKMNSTDMILKTSTVIG